MTVGIYCIENLLDGKKYIGKSENIAKRFITHRSRLSRDTRDEYTNRHLYSAVKLYGLDSFKFWIVEECAVEVLGIREVYWQDFFDANNRDKGYNMLRDSSGSPKHSQESKDRISKANSGVPKTAEHRNKLAEANIGKKRSRDSKLKQATFSYAQYTQDGVLVNTFDVMSDATALGFSASHIRAVCKGAYGCKTHKGFIWKKTLKNTP